MAQYEGKTPGVYVLESATPPSTVPDVTISRLMLIGALPWTDSADEDKRIWPCTSWRDVLNKAQLYFRDDKGKELKESTGAIVNGQAILRELQNNLRWENSKPKSGLGKFANTLNLPALSSAVSAPTTTGTAAPAMTGTTAPATTNGGQIALTLHSLKTYFENGGGSAVVFHPESDEAPGDDFNQELLRKLDIGILCAPGRSKDFYTKLRDICGTRDSEPDGDAFCFLLIDEPREEPKDKAKADLLFPKGYAYKDHSCASFGPWLRSRTALEETTEDRTPAEETTQDRTPAEEKAVVIPPSPAVAGFFAACDSAYGPQRAAAGLTFQIQGNWELDRPVSDQLAGQLNESGRNQIRQFGNGQPPVIWGARTLSENIDLRYIPVARTLLYFRKAIKASLRIFVFYPNNSELREYVYRMLYTYLEDRRRKGWLKGSTAEEAFAITFPTSPDDAKKGILRIRVEVALARPAEFIEVEITQLQEFGA